MGVASPEDMAEVFKQRFNDRDEAGLLSLYAPDAVFTMDGQALARGTEEIKAAMAGMFASPFQMKGKYDSVLIAGDTAVCKLRWEMLNAEGWIEMDGVSLEVLRKGGDGQWRFIVDDATGSSREQD
ncbi:MAG: nuclear transport factor 2 family protein [Hyphomonadaceae bacterium]